ncbi:MAG: tetratricopeptide repeat protein [Syntrophaceae bacterium]|nr:tetratricopeptide repeat protein [Syntrophaceae bacterium]
MPRQIGSEMVTVDLAEFKKRMNSRKTNVQYIAENSVSPRGRKLQSQLEIFENDVRQHPEVAHNWFDLGMYLLETGRNPEAESAFREAISREPESVNYRYFLADALGNNGKFEEAAGHFRELVDIDPGLNHPVSVIGFSVIKDLAYCLGEMGCWDDAVKVYRPAIGLLISILDDLATFASRLGNYDLAAAYYSMALLFNQNSGALLHGAGCSLKDAGQLDEALVHLRKARRRDSENPDICYDLGLTLAMMRKGKHARSWFQKALKLNPHHLWAWYDLACLDALENKPAAAFRKLFKSVECGFRDTTLLKKDPDLKSLRKDLKWKLVLGCISDKAKFEENQKNTPGNC